MNQARAQVTLFAPDEITALFECPAADLPFTVDNLRYLGIFLNIPAPDGR